MNYDDYKEGLHDPNSPMNEKEEPEQLTIDDLLVDHRIDDAREELDKIVLEIKRLIEYAKASDNTYLKNRLTEIYQKL